MFSIVIPLYNKEKSISNTVLSVLAQTYTHFEIIVVNDGSTDHSLEKVREFDDSRIRVIEKANGGVSKARNSGIANATFQWIAFLDADDTWTPNHLATLFDLIQKFPDDKVFCTSFIRSTERANRQDDSSVRIIEDYFKEAMQQLFFWTSVTCIHRTVFTEVGYFPVGFSRGEDLDLWNRIGRNYRFIRSNLITATYNTDSENKLTHAKYKYRNSTLYSVHKRIQSFSSRSEKQYYLKSLFGKQKYFFKRLHFGHAFKTMYRYFILLSKPVQK